MEYGARNVRNEVMMAFLVGLARLCGVPFRWQSNKGKGRCSGTFPSAIWAVSTKQTLWNRMSEQDGTACQVGSGLTVRGLEEQVSDYLAMYVSMQMI